MVTRTALMARFATIAAALVFLGAGCAGGDDTSSDAALPPDLPAPVASAPDAPAPPEPTIGIPGRELVGLWQTECLVPEPDDDWSERHTFVFNPDGTAQHIRSVGYDHSCNGDEDVSSYRYLVPKEGQIDLADTELGMTMFDVYAVEGSTLKLGHGFRNHFPYPLALGDSPGSRISTLNDYIVYRKQ